MKSLMSPRKAALELSVSTIVVIVLGVTMLIIGMVLVRNIMCGALGLTGDINGKVRGEITRLFASSESEVQCVGAGSDPVQMTPGKLNFVYCAIRAEQPAEYRITAKEIRVEGITRSSEVNSWIEGNDKTWSGRVSPGDNEPKKVLRLRVPSDAPESSVFISLEIAKGSQVTTKELDFEIKRVGLVKSSVC